MNDIAAEHRSLRARILSATLWIAIARILVRIISLGTVIFVARTVPQPILGTFGILLILDTGLQAVVGFGYGPAIVQMLKEPEQRYIDTCWTTNIIRGVVIFSLEFIAAPYWCGFYGVPEAVWPMRVYAVAQLFYGFHSMSTILLERSLRFDRLFFTHAAETISYAAITVIACSIRPDIWSLVFGYIGSFGVRAITSYIVWPVRARLRFDRAAAKEMFPYTKWILAYAVADFLLEMSDNATVARVLGKERLAQYQKGYQLSMELPVFLRWVVGTVMFPAIATMQVRPESVRLNFRAMLGSVTATMSLAAIGLFLLAKPLVILLLGPSWAPAAVPLRILAGAAVLRSTIDVAPPILRGLGRTRADFILKASQVIVMCALLWPAAQHFGVEGVAWAVVAGAIAVLPIWAFLLRRVSGVGAADFLSPIVSPLVSAGVATLVFGLMPAPAATWASLLGHGIGIVVTYAVVSAAMYRLLPRSGVGAAIHGVGA